MDKRAQQRVGHLLEQFFDNLNREAKMQGLSERWFYNKHPNFPFSVVEKALPGMLFLDGRQVPEAQARNKGGTKTIDHGGVTARQLEILEATSKNDMEFLHRLALLVFEKKDTTASVITHGLDMAEIEKMIEQKSKERAVEILHEMKKRELGTSEALAKAVLEAVPPSQGVVPEKAPRVDVLKRKESIHNVWRTRAKILGIKEPTMTKAGLIHSSWIKNATIKWNAYIETNPEARQIQLHYTQQPEAVAAAEAIES